MSVFTKSSKDAAGPGVPPKPEGQAVKPPLPQASRPAPHPPGPPVLVSRTIEVGGGPRSQPRPSAPPLPIRAPDDGVPATAPSTDPAKPSTSRVESPPAPSSVGPAAPTVTETERVVAIADTFERLLSNDVEQGFAALERAPGSSPKIDVVLTDLAEVRSLFAQLAANHVRQVRDFMLDVRWGEATVDWIGICEPALSSLRRAAEKMDLFELCGALDRFSSALTGTQTKGGRTIDGDRREALLRTYEELSATMPQAFALDLDRSQREAVILQSLLLQVPDVKKVTVDKLYAAGLTTLEAMLLATPGDVVATTGIDETLAAQIVGRFRQYKEQLRKTVPDAARASERAKIGELTARLRREHLAFEASGSAWTRQADAHRKDLRRRRAQTLLDIQVVLARLGEVDRIKDMERLPFDRKILHLESFLEEARDTYQAQP
jgi:hypothetical protein